MKIDKALEIIKALADGKNPQTSESFSASSPYQHPDTVRALFLAAEALEKYKTRKDRQESLPEKAGRPWTKEEDRWIMDGCDDGAEMKEMAEQHGRTEGAIKSRLIKLGKIQITHD